MIEVIGIIVAIFFTYYAGTAIGQAHELEALKPHKAAQLKAEAANATILALAGAVLAVIA